jgi:hypothetical protein
MKTNDQMDEDLLQGKDAAVEGGSVAQTQEELTLGQQNGPTQQDPKAANTEGHLNQQSPPLTKQMWINISSLTTRKISLHSLAVRVLIPNPLLQRYLPQQEFLSPSCKD